MKIIFEDESNSLKGTRRKFQIRNHYTRMQDLVKILRARVLPGLFQRARQRLIGGQVIHFSEELKANEEGLEINKALMPYDTIITEIAQNSIRLHHKTDPKKRLYKSKIPKIRNLDLLLDFIENPPKQTG